ncbi:MAG: subclass B3 metallo-beta-lactamase [Terricaulis sp.]
MKKHALALLTLLAACAAPDPVAPAPTSQPPLASEAQIVAAEQTPLGEQARGAHWNDAFAPFNVMANIYYVGPAGVSSYLITTPDGHFLIDGGLPQSGPIIEANIAALGFDIRDVKFLLNTHAHYDHAGGLARLQHDSGAVMAASAPDRAPLEAGRIPYGPSADIAFPPVRVERVIADGDTLTLGGVTLTAVMTPGHTEGCTSWMMDIAGPDGARHRAFFHCSATVGGQSVEPPSYPGMVEAYRATFARIRTLEADMLLANHGAFFDLAAKRARLAAGDANAFVDAGELQRFNAETEAAFNEELARQRAAARSN